VEAEATRLHGPVGADEWAASAAAWEASAAAWAGLGRPPLVAYARWREAEALLASRADRGAAAAALRDAHAIASQHGAQLLLDEIRALATRARLVLEPDGESAMDGSLAGDGAGSPEDVAAAARASEAARLVLTGRELEVLGLVALGRTNRQIADELFISTNTAGVHVSNILGKLAVTGRGEAAAIAHRLGLLERV
jgi:DNA-binding NarL/FixJ family response regulator